MALEERKRLLSKIEEDNESIYFVKVEDIIPAPDNSASCRPLVALAAVAALALFGVVKYPQYKVVAFK